MEQLLSGEGNNFRRSIIGIEELELVRIKIMRTNKLLIIRKCCLLKSSKKWINNGVRYNNWVDFVKGNHSSDTFLKIWFNGGQLKKMQKENIQWSILLHKRHRFANKCLETFVCGKMFSQSIFISIGAQKNEQRKSIYN